MSSYTVALICPCITFGCANFSLQKRKNHQTLHFCSMGSPPPSHHYRLSEFRRILVVVPRSAVAVWEPRSAAKPPLFLLGPGQGLPMQSESCQRGCPENCQVWLAESCLAGVARRVDVPPRAARSCPESCQGLPGELPGVACRGIGSWHPECVQAGVRAGV